jgi:aspartate aminotransferase
MSIINKRVAAVAESATLAVMAKAAALKAQGKTIIDLSTGEPDLDLPAEVKAAAIKAIEQGKNKYTPVAGIMPLREALAAKFKADNQIDTDPSRVIVTNGGKQALHSLFDVILEPGDEVIIPAPYWVSFPAMVQLSSGTPVIADTDWRTGYKLKPETLAELITDKTKAVIINSPSNPCGVAYSAAELRALGEVIARSKAYVVSDEVYEKITFDGFTHTSFAAANPALAERTITVNAFSKSYAMTGWRVGYATGPKEIIAAMIKHQGQTTSGVNSIAQHAALACLSLGNNFTSGMSQTFNRRIEKLMTKINNTPGLAIPSKPQGAFYLFIRIDEYLKNSGGSCNSSAQFAELLLDKIGLAAVPGAAFGDDGAVRISVGCPDAELEKAVAALATLVA